LDVVEVPKLAVLGVSGFIKSFVARIPSNLVRWANGALRNLSLSAIAIAFH